jgi:hypothetical protein
MELALAGMEHDEQERESEVVEDRADRAEYKHEPLDAPVVPARWLTQGLGVDVVGWDVCLGRVADQVIEQDLAGQHRQEGEEQRRPGHAQHVAEVRADSHPDVFERVGRRAPAFSDSLRDRRQARLEKDDVGRGPRDIGALVDADADVREVERRRVIDAVGEVADDRAAASGSGTQRTRVSGVPL